MSPRRALLAAALALAAVPAAAAPARAPAAAAPRAITVISNANEVDGLAVLGGRLYAATRGGVVAWDIATGALVRKWTSVDGLLGNRAYAIAACELPAPTLVVGTLEGLSLFDPARGRWTKRTPLESPMAAAAVTCLAPDRASRTVHIGYSYAGVDVYDGARRAWRHYATVDGLVANRVQAIAVSPGAKQAWVVAQEGVSRIEGGRIRKFTRKDIGITVPLTTAAAVDRAGAFWTVTVDGTLLTCARDAWKPVDVAGSAGAVVNGSAGVTAGGDGAVWFVTIAGELCRLRPGAAACDRYGRPPLGGAATAVCLSADTVAFVATHVGVFARSLRAGGGWRALHVTGEALRTNAIRALAQDGAGTVWIGTQAGACLADPAAPSRVRAATDAGFDWRGAVNALYADPAGGMWVGTTGGVAHVQRGACTWLKPADGLAGGDVRAIERDAAGRMWFGTSQGLSVWDGSKFRNFGTPDGLGSPLVHALCARRDEMFVGTDANMVRWRNAVFEALDDDKMGIEFESMHAIARYGRDSLAIGTNNGLSFIDGRTGRDDAELYGDEVSALAVGPALDLWAGTLLRGVFHRGARGSENLRTADGLPSNRITALLVDRAGGVWVGTSDAGLARLAPRPAARRR